MASLPPRQASQRRTSPEQASPNSAQHPANFPPSPVRAHSEDSQTLFLGSPDREQPQDQQQPQAQASAPSANDTDTDIKKCWICFSDSTEDTPETSPWRDPCPCALVAHEECLLDWIADMEAPNNRRSNRSMAAPKIECPQCKSEIKLARPRNLVVEAVRGAERLGAQLITPGALTVLVGTVYHSSMLWGVNSIYAVFGADDGFRILRPLLFNHVRPPTEFENGTPAQVGQRLLAVALDHVVHWRLYVGLPLITPMLVLSRTTLADSVLPVLPILFFATQTHSPSDNSLDFGQWPPSASLAFAILPYIRTAYNIFYRRLFADKEKQWLKEIQPRVSQAQAEGNADVGNGGHNHDHDHDDDDNVFEVRIDGGIWEDWEEEDEEVRQEVHQQLEHAPPVLQQQQEAGDEQQQPNQQNGANAPHNHPPPQQPAPAPAGGERRLSFSPTSVAETVLGALVFPAIAGLSGEMLKLSLPRSWTTKPPRIGAKGLLQEKWGRSLVGGCLFVVAKDVVMLYVRWKMAQMHRKRRVLDYQGKKVRA